MDLNPRRVPGTRKGTVPSLGPSLVHQGPGDSLEPAVHGDAKEKHRCRPANAVRGGGRTFSSLWNVNLSPFLFKMVVVALLS